MMPTVAVLGLGVTEMLVIGGIAVLLFGARRLPELGRSLGRGIVEFKKGIQGVDDDPPKGDGPEPPPPAPRPPHQIT